MGLVSLTAHVSGTILTAAALNNNDNAIINQLNGNVEAVNLANLAVTTAKINTGAVTYAKLDAGVILGMTTVTGVSTDYIAISDTSDSGNIKKCLASDFIVVAATQAEMETASSTTVYASPGRVKYNPGVAKSWINFVGTGTPTANGSLNVSSITDNGTGDYTINFTTAFSAAGYAVAGVIQRDESAGANSASQVGIYRASGALAVGSARILTGDNGGTLVDPTLATLVFFGDQ